MLTEVDWAQAVWRKSTYSDANGGCVEVALTGHAVGMRDSIDPASPMLIFSLDEWRAFVEAIKRGDLDG